MRVRVRVRGRPFASLLHRVSEGEGGWMCEAVLVARMQDDNLYLCLSMAPAAPPGKPMVLLAGRGAPAGENSCRQEWVPAGAPLPANNTWACRGAPPAPWT